MKFVLLLTVFIITTGCAAVGEEQWKWEKGACYDIITHTPIKAIRTKENGRYAKVVYGVPHKDWPPKKIDCPKR